MKTTRTVTAAPSWPRDHALHLSAKGADFKADWIHLVPVGSSAANEFDVRQYDIDGRPCVRSNWSPRQEPIVGFMRALPEAKIDKGQLFQWTLAATEFNIAELMRAKDQGMLLLVDATAGEILDSILLRAQAGADRMRLVAQYKADKTMPPLPKWWLEVKEPALSDYQRLAVLASLASEGYAIHFDRGVGKTPAGVQRMCMHARMAQKSELFGVPWPSGDGRMFRALFVVPQQVRVNWRREIIRFAPTKGKVIVCRGDRHERVRQLVEAIAPQRELEWSACIMSYDTLVHTELVSAVPWDLVVADEAHNFKDPSTRRWAAMRKLRETSRSRLELTGTPIGNSVMDLWTQLEWLEEGASTFRDYKAFKKYFGVYVRQEGPGGGVDKLVGLQNAPVLQERLARISFKMSKEEAGLKLPPKVTAVREVQMAAQQRTVYEQVAGQLAAEIEERLEDTTTTSEVVVQNILTSLLRLAQITAGHVTVDPILDPDGNILQAKRIVHFRPNPKFDALVEMIREEEDSDVKFIAFSTWVPTLTTLGDRLREEGIKFVEYYGKISPVDRDAAVDAYNRDPEVKVFVGNQMIAGEGLNLLGYNHERPDDSTTRTGHVVFLSNNWSSIMRRQGEDRAHRRGTRGTVQITDIMAADSVDEVILDRVSEKIQMAESVTDVRDILRAVLDGLRFTE